MSKRRVRWILIIIAVLVVAAVIVVPLVLRSKHNPSTGGINGTGGDDIYTVVPQDIFASTTVSGTVAPAHSATVTAPAAGKIAAIYRARGERIAAGEVIARIDDSDYRDELKQAEFHYRSAIFSAETVDLTSPAQTRAQLENALNQAQTQELTAEINLKNATAKEGTPDTTIANLQDAVTQAEEGLTTAQTNLKNLQDHDTTALQEQLADASVEQAELDLSMAQTKLAGLKSQDVTPTQLKTLQEQLRQAKTSLLSAQAGLQEAVRNTSTTDAQLNLLQDQVDTAQAALDEAQENLDNAHTTYRASQEDIDNQAIAVQQAQMALANAEANDEITRDTLAQKKDGTTAAQLAVTQAERGVAAAKRNLATGQSTVQSTAVSDAENIRLLTADVEQAKVAVAAARTNLAAFPETVRKYNLQLQANDEQKEEALYTLNAEKKKTANYSIIAPMNGTILTMNVARGDTVTSGAIIAKLTDQTTWNASVYVDEMNIIKLKAGQNASVTIDPYGDKTFRGKITSVGYAPASDSQNSSGTALPYMAIIRLENPPSSLMTGMKCDASVTLSIAKNVPAVPVESVISDNGKYYVMVVTQVTGTGKKQNTRNATSSTRKEVTVGIASDDYIQIVSGLKMGDHILRNAGVSSMPQQPSSDADGSNGTVTVY